MPSRSPKRLLEAVVRQHMATSLVFVAVSHEHGRWASCRGLVEDVVLGDRDCVAFVGKGR